MRLIAVPVGAASSQDRTRICTFDNRQSISSTAEKPPSDDREVAWATGSTHRAEWRCPSSGLIQMQRRGEGCVYLQRKRSHHAPQADRIRTQPSRSSEEAHRLPSDSEVFEPRRLLSTNVLTFHNNNMQNGLNPNETVLTPSNVNWASFGKISSIPLDGTDYVQPL